MLGPTGSVFPCASASVSSCCLNRTIIITRQDPPSLLRSCHSIHEPLSPTAATYLHSPLSDPINPPSLLPASNLFPSSADPLFRSMCIYAEKLYQLCSHPWPVYSDLRICEQQRRNALEAARLRQPIPSCARHTRRVETVLDEWCPACRARRMEEEEGQRDSRP